jgi:hypothetical protein
MCEQLNKVSKLVRSNVVTSIKLLNTESKGGDQVKIDGAKLSLTAFVGALLIFASLPGADQCTDFMKFHKVVLNTGSLKGIVAACKGDMN